MSPELPSLLAAADQQRALTQNAVNQLVERCRQLMAAYGDESTTWALLAEYIVRNLDLEGKYPQFAAECLATMVLSLAKQDVS